MDNRTTLTDYSLTVHKSLFHIDQLFGIGTNAAMILIITTIVFMNLVGLWFIFIGLGILFLLRILCKDDPYLLDITLENLMEQDEYV